MEITLIEVKQKFLVLIEDIEEEFIKEFDKFD